MSCRAWMPVAVVVLLGMYGTGHLTSGLRAAASALFTFTGTIGQTDGGSGPGQFLYPLDVTTGPQDRVYVADTQNHRIQVFNADGTYFASFGVMGEVTDPFVDVTPDPPGEFNYPSGLVVDQAGNVLVVDADNHRLQLFRQVGGPNGTQFQFVKSFGSYGNYDPLDPDHDLNPTLTNLNYPTRVAILPGTVLDVDPSDDGSVPAGPGRVALVDSGNHRVILLDARLNPLSTFGTHGVDGNGLGELEYPWGISMDAQFIYIADQDNHRVQIFSQAGVALSAFGSVGASHSADGLDQPYDVQPDGQGNLIVVDYGRSHVLFMTPVPAADPTVPLCSSVTAAAAAGECTIVATNGTVYDALVIGGFTPIGTELGKFSHPHAAALDSQGRLLVADTDGHRIVIFRPAHLTVSGVLIEPATDPVQSGLPVTLQVTVVNDGAAGLLVSAVVSADRAGDVLPSLPVFLDPGASTTIPVTFVTAATGPVNFTVRASGQPAVGKPILSTAVPAGPITVSPAPGPKLNITVAAPPSPVGLGTAFQVQVIVTNNGTSTLSQVTPAVDFAPALVSLTKPPAVVRANLLPNTSRTYVFTYTASAVGTVTFTPRATAKYPDQTQPGGMGTYQTIDSQTATVTINSDVQKPKTTIVSVSPSPAASGWYLAPVTVVLKATDNTAVASIHYSVTGLVGFAGETPGANATVNITRDGPADLTYWAEDTAHNVEAPSNVRHFDIDATAPAIAVGSIDPAPNGAGWVNQYPTVTFTASDAGSGQAFLTPPVRVQTDRAGQVVTGIARDVAGNSSQVQVTVNVDTKAPTLACAPIVAATGLNGWYTNPGMVTVGCVAFDQIGLSGMASLRAICPTTTGTAAVTAGSLLAATSCTITGEGVHTVIGEAKDVAGNLTATSLTIKIDRTPPVVSCSVSATPIVWPPNHKMVAWNPVVTVTAAIPGATFKLVAFYSNEDDNGHGDGNTDDDMTEWTLNTADTSGMIRAERSGNGSGRVYTLKYLATDLAGNTASCSISVTVPHDQGKDTKGEEGDHDGRDCDDRNHRHGDRR